MDGVRKKAQTPPTTSLLLLLILGLLGYATAQMSEISDSLAQALRGTQMNDEVLVSEWTSGGISKTYTTTQQANESQADHAKRHAKGLAAMLAEFPKDE